MGEWFFWGCLDLFFTAAGVILPALHADGFESVEWFGLCTRLSFFRSYFIILRIVHVVCVCVCVCS